MRFCGQLMRQSLHTITHVIRAAQKGGGGNWVGLPRTYHGTKIEILLYNLIFFLRENNSRENFPF